MWVKLVSMTALFTICVNVLIKLVFSGLNRKKSILLFQNGFMIMNSRSVPKEVVEMKVQYTCREKI